MRFPAPQPRRGQLPRRRQSLAPGRLLRLSARDGSTLAGPFGCAGQKIEPSALRKRSFSPPRQPRRSMVGEGGGGSHARPAAGFVKKGMKVGSAPPDSTRLGSARLGRSRGRAWWTAGGLPLNTIRYKICTLLPPHLPLLFFFSSLDFSSPTLLTPPRLPSLLATAEQRFHSLRVP